MSAQLQLGRLNRMVKKDPAAALLGKKTSDIIDNLIAGERNLIWAQFTGASFTTDPIDLEDLCINSFRSCIEGSLSAYVRGLDVGDANSGSFINAKETIEPFCTDISALDKVLLNKILLEPSPKIWFYLFCETFDRITLDFSNLRGFETIVKDLLGLILREFFRNTIKERTEDYPWECMFRITVSFEKHNKVLIFEDGPFKNVKLPDDLSIPPKFGSQNGWGLYGTYHAISIRSGGRKLEKVQIEDDNGLQHIKFLCPIMPKDIEERRT